MKIIYEMILSRYEEFKLKMVVSDPNIETPDALMVAALLQKLLRIKKIHVYCKREDKKYIPVISDERIEGATYHHQHLTPYDRYELALKSGIDWAMEILKTDK